MSWIISFFLHQLIQNTIFCDHDPSSRSEKSGWGGTYTFLSFNTTFQANRVLAFPVICIKHQVAYLFIPCYFVFISVQYLTHDYEHSVTVVKASEWVILMFKPKTAFQLYEDTFETPFLKETGDYYRSEASRLKADCTCSEYMEKVSERNWNISIGGEVLKSCVFWCCDSLVISGCWLVSWMIGLFFDSVFWKGTCPMVGVFFDPVLGKGTYPMIGLFFDSVLGKGT